MFCRSAFQVLSQDYFRKVWPIYIKKQTNKTCIGTFIGQHKHARISEMNEIQPAVRLMSKTFDCIFLIYNYCAVRSEVELLILGDAFLDIISFSAGWVPQYFSFNYNHVTFLFLPTLDFNSSRSYIPSMVWLCFSLIIPYLLMVSLP